MSVAVNELDRLTEHQWRMLVGRDCASAAARFELIAEGLVESAALRPGDAVLDVARRRQRCDRRGPAAAAW